MRVERSPSQILFSFLPEQTADLEGRIWKVKEWRDPEPLLIDELSLRRRLLGAVHPWSSSNPRRDRSAAQELLDGHTLEVVTLNRSRGVAVDAWPEVYVCQRCRRISNSRGSACRCGARRWSQLPFVGYHECGFLTAPWIPRCPTHDDVQMNSPGTAQAKDLRFTCPTCNNELLRGLGAGRPCRGCNTPGISYTVHRAASVYTSHGFTMVTPARPDQLNELNAIGGAAHCLDWILDGMPGDRPQAAPRSAGTLYEQMIAMGLSEVAAQAAVAAAQGAGQEFGGASASAALPPDKLGESRDEALDIAISVYNGRATVDSLARQASSDDLKTRFSVDYPASIGRAGLESVDLVDRFPVLRGVFGYSRDSASQQSRLVMFRGKRGAYRVYADRTETEALFLKLDPVRVARWLHARGLLLSAPANSGEARLAIISAADIPQRGDDVPQETAGSAVLTLLHSFTHRLIRTAAVYAGIDRDALAEYLVPRHLAAFIYAGSRGDFVLGGLQAVFENDLDDLLDAMVFGDPRCPLDPGCQRSSGACPACSHLGEPSCSYYNRFLDRRLLFGRDGFLGMDH
jgi:hypothetical protein